MLFHTISYRFILFPGMRCNSSSTAIQDMDIDPDKFNIIEDMDQVISGRPELIFEVTLRRYSVTAYHSIIISEEDTLDSSRDPSRIFFSIRASDTG